MDKNLERPGSSGQSSDNFFEKKPLPDLPFPRGNRNLKSLHIGPKDPLLSTTSSLNYRLENRKTLPKLIKRDNSASDRHNDQNESEHESTFITDLNKRFASFEALFYEFKMNIEKRVVTLNEELIARTQKETVLINPSKKDSDKLQIQIETGFSNLKAKIDQKFIDLNQEFLELQRNNQEQEFKITTLQRTVETFDSNSMQTRTLKFEKEKLDVGVSFKDPNLTTELNKRDIIIEELRNQVKAQSVQSARLEKEFQQKLKTYKDEIILFNTDMKNQKVREDSLKQDRNLDEFEAIRRLVHNLEQKIQLDDQKKARSEMENKQWLDKNLQQLKEEMIDNRKKEVHNEKQTLEEFSDGFRKLNQIIKSSKENLEAKLATAQTYLEENIKSVAGSVGQLRNEFEGKFTTVDSKANSMVEALVANQKFAGEGNSAREFIVEKEFQRINKVAKAMEELLKQNLKSNEDRLAKEKKEHEEWKANFEEKSYNVFTEVRNTLKGMKTDLLSEKKDKADQLSRMKSEIISQSEKNENLYKNLEEYIKHYEEQFNFRLKELEFKQNEFLENGLDSFGKKLNKLLEDAQKEAKQDFYKQLDDIKKSIDPKIKAEVESLGEKTKRELLSLEERAAAPLKLLGDKIEKKISLIEGSFKSQQSIDRDEVERVKLQIINQDSIFKDELISLKNDLRNIKLTTLGFSKNAKENNENSSAIQLDTTQERPSSKQRLKVSLGGDDAKFLSSLESLRKDLILKLSQAVETLKSEILEEREGWSEKFANVLNNMKGLKQMFVETVNQKFESGQSLTRALINEENAGRKKDSELILKISKENLLAQENLLKNLVNATAQELKANLAASLEALSKKISSIRIFLLQELAKTDKKTENLRISFDSYAYLQELLRRLNDENAMSRFEAVDKELTQLSLKIRDDFEILSSNANKNYEDILKHQLIIDIINKNIEANELNTRENLQALEQKLQDLEAAENQIQEENLSKFEKLQEAIHEKATQILVKLEEEMERISTDEALINSKLEADKSKIESLEIDVQSSVYLQEIYQKLTEGEFAKLQKANDLEIKRNENCFKNYELDAVSREYLTNLILRVTIEEDYHSAVENQLKLKAQEEKMEVMGGQFNKMITENHIELEAEQFLERLYGISTEKELLDQMSEMDSGIKNMVLAAASSQRQFSHEELSKVNNELRLKINENGALMYIDSLYALLEARELSEQIENLSQRVDFDDVKLDAQEMAIAKVSLDIARGLSEQEVRLQSQISLDKMLGQIIFEDEQEARVIGINSLGLEISSVEKRLEAFKAATKESELRKEEKLSNLGAALYLEEIYKIIEVENLHEVMNMNCLELERTSEGKLNQLKTSLSFKITESDERNRLKTSEIESRIYLESLYDNILQAQQRRIQEKMENRLQRDMNSLQEDIDIINREINENQWNVKAKLYLDDLYNELMEERGENELIRIQKFMKTELENLHENDENIVNGLNSVVEKIEADNQSLQYLNSLYDTLNEERYLSNRKFNISCFETIKTELSKTNEKVLTLEDEEKKFRIYVDSGLTNLTDFLNRVDSRATVDDILLRATQEECFRSIEDLNANIKKTSEPVQSIPVLLATVELLEQAATTLKEFNAKNEKELLNQSEKIKLLEEEATNIQASFILMEDTMKAEQELIKTDTREGLGLVHDAFEQLKAIEVNDFSMNDIEKLIESKMSETKNSQAEAKEKVDENLKKISADVSALGENLKSQIEKSQEEQKVVVKTMSEQMQKLSTTVESLQSKLYVNKE